MVVSFRPLITEQDGSAVVAFLSGDTWPFHVVERPDPEWVRGRVSDGYVSGSGVSSFWVVRDDERVGLIRLQDLEDPTPLFDLRIATAHRGQGFGKASVRWLTQHLFDSYPAINRIEAQTRVDNTAMRRILLGAHYVKEAHYREAWPAEKGALDSVGYAILRRDHTSGSSTPVDWGL